MSTLSTTHDELTEQLARTTDLRWQAVLHYVRTIEQGGGKVRLGFEGDTTTRVLRMARATIGDEFATITRTTPEGRRDWDALPTAEVAGRDGDWILYGWDGVEDLWQVAARYRYVAAVTHPDEPTESVHVLLRLEA